MQPIDIVSILFLFVLTCTFVAIFFTFDAILFKKKDRTTLMYIASKYIQAISVAILIVQGYSTNTTLIIWYNLLFFAGIAGEVYTIITIYTARKKLHRTVLSVAVFIASFYNIINVLLDFPLAYRLLVVGLFTFGLYAYFALVMLLKKDISKMQKVTGWISLVFSIPWGLRTYYVIMNFSTAEVLSTNILQTIAYVGTIVFFSVLPMLYLLTIKEKDQQKLQEQYKKIVLQNDEILVANEQLKALNATKDKFFKIIGHDLKGPIVQMIQLSELFEDSYTDVNDKKMPTLIRAMRESSVRGFKLLENLLDWARSQTGDISFNPEPVFIMGLILGNIELIKEQAEAKSITVKTIDLYEGKVTIDRNMINTVIRNLLSNAIKFTRMNGEVEIRNCVDKNNLIVSVKDNGIGMSGEDCSRLFKIGREHIAVGTNNETGTGIGLVLCKEFIDKHNSSIWVESKKGEGSVFYFSIPIS